MKKYRKIVFVGQSGTTIYPIAKSIMEDCMLKAPIEVHAKGLVVLFEEPMNQKAEAVLISNGINLEGFTSKQFGEEDLQDDTLVLTMEQVQKDRILELYEGANPENIQVLTTYVGDELEILDPYGGALPSYGLCYETLRKSIKKLVNILNEGD